MVAYTVRKSWSPSGHRWRPGADAPGRSSPLLASADNMPGAPPAAGTWCRACVRPSHPAPRRSHRPLQHDSIDRRHEIRRRKNAGFLKRRHLDVRRVLIVNQPSAPRPAATRPSSARSSRACRRSPRVAADARPGRNSSRFVRGLRSCAAFLQRFYTSTTPWWAVPGYPEAIAMAIQLAFASPCVRHNTKACSGGLRLG
jgi:hypothetical protein